MYHFSSQLLYTFDALPTADCLCNDCLNGMNALSTNCHLQGVEVLMPKIFPSCLRLIQMACRAAHMTAKGIGL